jgi:bifunctional DNA-binding transcriptional regulator/antitoxin component of YhaV-PrlF toxin-antitoxin module
MPPVACDSACCARQWFRLDKTYLLSVQSRGTVALPADLRRRLHLDRPDAQIKLIEQEDGRIELVPVVTVPAEQAWFWTDRWQDMEREADADIAAGRTTVVDGLDGLLDHLARAPGR